jgi:hypothetical protein
MAETARPRPALVAPRQVQTLEAVREVTGGGFDVDAWHVMEARDDALIRDEILHGAGSSTFVYSFDIGGGKIVSGISVIGARHLAHYYKGLKHRMVASTAKTGKLLTFTSYPSEFGNMSMTTAVLDDLEAEEDFYSAICEIIDIKTGNSIQVERREARYEERRGGGWFERPNYPTIAQSKAYRNAILALLPQDVIIPWKLDQLKLKKEEIITASVLDEKRANVLHFAAQKAIALDRHAVEGLTLDQIAGMGDAAREGQLPAFVSAAQALGLDIEVPPEAIEPQPGQQQSRRPAQRAAAPTQPRGQARQPAGAGPTQPSGQTRQPAGPGGQQPAGEGGAPGAQSQGAAGSTATEPAKTGTPADQTGTDASSGPASQTPSESSSRPAGRGKVNFEM